MTGSRPDYRLVRPFADVLVVPVAGSDRMRSPEGWVFGDIYFITPNTNNMRWCASQNRGLNSFAGGALLDKESGELPFAIDWTLSGGIFPGQVDYRWLDIGFAEIRCIFADQIPGGFGANEIIVWGTLVPDPRRYD